MMKTNRIYMLILAVAMVALSCKSDDPDVPNAKELAFEKLSGQWGLGQTGSIKVDGSNVSPNYPGFALSFTDGGYTTTNAGDLFNASGTWEWTDEDAQTLTLDDGKLIMINSLTTTEFIFSFTKSEGSVRAGIEGNYVVTVIK